MRAIIQILSETQFAKPLGVRHISIPPSRIPHYRTSRGLEAIEFFRLTISLIDLKAILIMSSEGSVQAAAGSGRGSDGNARTSSSADPHLVLPDGFLATPESK